jgi:hypothetical protein
MSRLKKLFKTFHWRMYMDDVARAEFIQQLYTEELSLAKPFDMAKIMRKLIHEEAMRHGYQEPRS